MRRSGLLAALVAASVLGGGVSLALGRVPPDTMVGDAVVVEPGPVASPSPSGSPVTPSPTPSATPGPSPSTPAPSSSDRPTPRPVDPPAPAAPQDEDDD